MKKIQKDSMEKTKRQEWGKNRVMNELKQESKLVQGKEKGTSVRNYVEVTDAGMAR